MRLQPHDQELAWRRSVDKQLADRQNAQLIAPQAWPAAPFGGATYPSGYWLIPVVAATFNSSNQATIPWIVQIDRVSHRAFSIDIPWVTDAGTTGEMRLAVINPPAPNSPTSAVAMGAGASGTTGFRWVHGLEPFTSGSDIWFQIEARRTSGTGNVYIGYPRGGGSMVSPENCTASGV